MGSTASKQAAAPSTSSAGLKSCSTTDIYASENPIPINRHIQKGLSCGEAHGQKKLLIPLLQRISKANDRSTCDNKPPKRNKKQKKKQNVTSLSTKRNPKYKKVTKSIIGRPTNFQHVSYVGKDRPFEPRLKEVQDIHDEALAGQLLDIAARLDAPPSDQQKEKLHPKHPQARVVSDYTRSSRSSEPPPPPPPHWSTLALRHAMISQTSLQSTRLFEDISAYASKKYNNEQQCIEKNSISRRRQPRKKNQSSITRQRRNAYSSKNLGMPPSLRLGPSR